MTAPVVPAAPIVAPAVVPVAAAAPVAPAKSGWRTSEFWVSLAAIFLTAIQPATDIVANGVANNTGAHNTNNVWGVLGPAVVATGYTMARSYVKSQAPGADQQGVQQSPPTPGP